MPQQERVEFPLVSVVSMEQASRRSDVQAAHLGHAHLLHSLRREEGGELGVRHHSAKERAGATEVPVVTNNMQWFEHG